MTTRPADHARSIRDEDLYRQTMASVEKHADVLGVPPDYRRMWFDVETELARLQRIEAAARAVLASGQARYTHLADDEEWIGDIVPAAEMAALRAAVEGADRADSRQTGEEVRGG